MTYKKAGVNIDEANLFVKRIMPLIATTKRRGVLGKIGGFGGLFDGRFEGIRNPILVSGTDGVGTKLLVAKELGKYDTVGIDLVAMCANDILTCGAEPLFFLDYFATGKLKRSMAIDVVKGIARGCRQAGCALIGGETAELPGMYKAGDFDLAGFCVGVVDKKKAIDGSGIKVGDRVIGIASSGLHSNGFSLIRKVFRQSELKTKYAASILKPTQIYVRPILSLVKKFNIKGISHITGGGFYDNIPRVLPKGKSVAICKNSWPVPSIFTQIQHRANIDALEMFRTFNMGIGMALIVRQKDAGKIGRLLRRFKLKSWVIGEVVRGKGEVII
ncbi:MAG: phosphoribosylformylglycinamidine cyclo-ligase [Candidatus Omnitrophica bacterium]|nr:phosphoribosylformylglycinamidine cyclo-ligase [Candidatus Omnitrophota bacterium]